jgi:ribonuclease HI
MLALLLEGMHVRGSTDSAYVKKGITEWMGGRIQRKWRTGSGAPVGNRELSQALIRAAERHVRVEWS